MNLDPSAFVADQELVAALEKRSTMIVCEEDRVLFRQGEPPTSLFILRSGRATFTMKSPAGEEVISMPISAGSLLGLPALILNEPYSLTASACKGAALGFMGRADFARLILTEPSLSIGVLRVLAAEVQTTRYAMSRL